MKALFAVVALTIIGLGGYFGYEYHQEQKRTTYLNQISKPLKNTSLRTIEHLEVLTSQGSNITFAEFFSKANSDIKKADENILELRTIAQGEFEQLNSLALSYTKQSQDMIRLVDVMLREQLSISTNMRLLKAEIEEMKTTTNQYIFERLNKSTDKLVKQIEESQTDLARTNTSISEALSNIKALNANLAEAGFATTDLIPSDALDAALASAEKARSTPR